MTITPTPIEPTGSRAESLSEPRFQDPIETFPTSDSPSSAKSAKKPSRRTPARASAHRLLPPEATAAHHALYRLYNSDGVLLYVGETNNPVERYVEHRETKEWWPEVATHSIEWSRKGRESVQEMERRAIYDEWPLYNVAHQPRGDGAYIVPSYVVEKILEAVRRAIHEVIGDAVVQDSDLVADLVDAAFKPNGDGEWGEIGFEFGYTSRGEALVLDAVLDAMGSFRPDIENSMRDQKPRSRPRKSCPVPTGDGHRRRTCGARLRRDGSCPRSERHAHVAPLTDPLAAVGGA